MARIAPSATTPLQEPPRLMILAGAVLASLLHRWNLLEVEDAEEPGLCLHGCRSRSNRAAIPTNIAAKMPVWQWMIEAEAEQGTLELGSTVVHRQWMIEAVAVEEGGV